jgi:hypothetical protein
MKAMNNNEKTTKNLRKTCFHDLLIVCEKLIEDRIPPKWWLEAPAGGL